MRVLVACSLGGAGHWNPLSMVVAGARDRGDDVLVVGPPALEAMIRRDGFDFAEGGEPPEHAIAPLRDRLATAPPGDASVIGNRELFGRLAATAMHDPLVEHARRFDPHLVVRDPCEYASAAFSVDAHIPMAQVAISLAKVEWGSLAVAAPALEERHTGLTDAIRSSPYISRFPAALDPSPFPTTIRCGATRRRSAEPLPDWWHGSTGPLVYATLGTVRPHMTDASDHYQLLIEALDGIGARVLLTVGHHFDPSSLGTVPDHVRVERWVDQHDVFAHAALTVCHGGSGTLFGSIAAGVPVVVVPSFADQFVNADVVEHHRLGHVVRAAERAGGDRRPLGSADRITDAVVAALDDADAARRCNAIARQFAEAPSVREVLDHVFDHRRR